MALGRSLLCCQLACGCSLLWKLEEGCYAALSFATRGFHCDKVAWGDRVVQRGMAQAFPLSSDVATLLIS